MGWLMWRPGFADVLANAWLPLMVAMLACFLGGAVLLLDAYRHVRIAHMRRQIRLIAAACLITTCFWLVCRVIPLILALPAPLPDAVIDLVPIIIPLAYLVSGVGSNLYTLERLVRRVAGGLLTVTIVALAVSATVVIAAQELQAAVVWWALVLGVLSKPFLAWTGRLGGDRRNPDRSYAALRQARQLLTTSLDPTVLLSAIRNGVQGAFDRPPMAIYHGVPENTSELILVQRDAFSELPPTLPLATLTNHLLHRETVREAHELHAELQTTSLSVPEETAVLHQGVALWCVVRQGSEKLLAIVLIGTDVSFEPYRADDRRELAELMDAAGLAFAHSTAYERVRKTEGMLRELIDAMRRVEDETSAEFAREIHDEIINIFVQLNITSLEQLISRVTDQAVRAELERLLGSERGLNKALRRICERLHPTGLRDPMGLPGVLRDLTRHVLAAWRGSYELQIEGNDVPIDSATQLETYRIAREALANVVKHAEATTITVLLRYPDRPGQPLTLVIADNGRSGKDIQARPGHWGLHNMHESARAAGGELEIERALGGGTSVVFSCPLGRIDVPKPLGARLVDTPLLSS
jgi:signal transduction histidine kinase